QRRGDCRCSDWPHHYSSGTLAGEPAANDKDRERRHNSGGCHQQPGDEFVIIRHRLTPENQTCSASTMRRPNRPGSPIGTQRRVPVNCVEPGLTGLSPSLLLILANLSSAAFSFAKARLALLAESPQALATIGKVGTKGEHLTFALQLSFKAG